MASSMPFKIVLFLLGILLAMPVLGVIALAFKLPTSIFGVGYLLACSFVVVGLLLAPSVQRYYLLVLAWILTIVLIAGARIILIERNSSSHIKMITLPQERGTRWLSTIIDEQDALLFGETLFHFIGGSSASEHENITQALHKDYVDMRLAEGIIASPVVNTYLGLQGPDAFDAVVFEPEENLHPDVGVIFLHGYMGNVTAQCWEIAQAVDRVGVVTICPSTEWRGEWWQPRGEAILRSTFDHLKERGVQKIYLGGFSNGGFSISRMTSTLGNEETLQGLIFIDGIDRGEDIRSLGLPVLIIQGTQDERVPALMVKQIAAVIGDLGTYVEIDSDHFLIMKQPKPVQDAIAAWLEDRLQESK